MVSFWGEGLPPLLLETRAWWIDLPPRLKQRVEEEEGGRLSWIGGVHAAQHLLLSLLPLHVPLCQHDLITECASPFQRRERPLRLVVVDAVPGGSGMAPRAFVKAQDIIRQALQVISSCECNGVRGCLACTMLPSCREYNVVLCKRAATMILAYVDGAIRAKGMGS